MLLLALCAPWFANAQNIIPGSLTVNDGNSISSSVPFRSDCVDYETHSQFIIPQAYLTAMRGGIVSKLTFYCSDNGSWDPARFSIYMAEVSETVFTNHNFDEWDWDSMSVVYTGELTINNKTVEIVLDSAFTYLGGNLKIGFMQVDSGEKIGDLTWDGVRFSNTINTSVICYSSNYVVPYHAFSHFLPKMTFEYYILDLPMAEVTIEDITPETAQLSWVVQSSDVTGYKYQYNKASESFTNEWIELSPTVTSITLENLASSTEYNFRIKACYGEYESSMTIVDFKTECPEYETIPYYEDFDSYEVADDWIPKVRALPDCWDYYNTTTNQSDTVYPTMYHRSTLSQFTYSQPNCFHFYIDNHMPYYVAKPQYAILPAMQNIRGLRVKLYARLYNSEYAFRCKLNVGVMEETGSEPEFISIQEIAPTATYELYTIDLNSYEGDGEHIAIWMEVPNTEYGSVFIDNIEVEQLPVFNMPIASHGGITGSGYYLISSPLAAETNPMNVPHLISANALDFDLYRFNPSPGNQGFVWENWKAEETDHYHFDLEPGRGYLYANAGNVNINFMGTPYEGNGQVTLVYDDEASLGGWNLVGNPFPFTTYIGDRDYLRMNDEGSGFVPATSGSAVGAMEGIFVYTETDGEMLTFSPTPPDRSNEQLSVDVSKITRSGLSTAIDRAILRFGEGDGLPKFQFNEKSAKVYIPQNGYDYAVVTTERQGEMPVNFSADENDTYTLNFNYENVEFSYLHLFDNKTGTDVDLLSTPSYTFNAMTTDYESRFKLVFATGSSVAGDSFSFINSNGNFCIFGIEGEATLEVFDVMGRVLSTETFSNSIDKRLNVAPGVYFIRLVNGDDVKTQKIVVR